jgi:hypothetical protein
MIFYGNCTATSFLVLKMNISGTSVQKSYMRQDLNPN